MTDRTRHYWILSLIIGAFAVATMTIAGTIGVFQLFVYKPSAVYYAMETPQWAPMNARLMAFSSPGDFQQAEKKLYKTLQTDVGHTNPVPYYLLASLFDYQGQNDRALQTYDAALQVANKDWYSSTVNRYLSDDVHANKAIIYYSIGKKELAQGELDQIQDLKNQTQYLLLSSLKNSLDYPQRGDFHFALAKELRHVLKLNLARQELQQALALISDPTSRERVYSFSKSRMPVKVAELSPLVRYYTLAASAQEDRKSGGSLQLAAALYQQVIQEEPNFEWAYQQLALVEKDLNHYDQAVYFAQKALEINPDFYLSHMTLADLALSKEQYPLALDHFSKARDILARTKDDTHQPLIVNIENQLGFTEELMENATSAITHYQTALSMATDNVDDDDDDYDYAKTGLQRAKDWLLEHKHPSSSHQVLADNKMPGKEN